MREMREIGIPPNVVCYTSLLAAHGGAGDIEAAHQVLLDMRADGVQPNNKTYTSLMAYYCKRGEVAKVKASTVALLQSFVM